jgi:hypothetical protein
MATNRLLFRGFDSFGDIARICFFLWHAETTTNKPTRRTT